MSNKVTVQEREDDNYRINRTTTITFPEPVEKPDVDIGDSPRELLDNQIAALLPRYVSDKMMSVDKRRLIISELSRGFFSGGDQTHLFFNATYRLERYREDPELFAGATIHNPHLSPADDMFLYTSGVFEIGKAEAVYAEAIVGRLLGLQPSESGEYDTPFDFASLFGLSKFTIPIVNPTTETIEKAAEQFQAFLGYCMQHYDTVAQVSAFERAARDLEDHITSQIEDYGRSEQMYLATQAQIHHLRKWSQELIDKLPAAPQVDNYSTLDQVVDR